MVDHQAVLSKVVQAMGGAVAVVVLLVTLVRNRDALEDRRTTVFDCGQMLLLQPFVNIII